MRVTINGTDQEFKQTVRLSSVIGQFCKEPKHIITELNGRVVPSNEWEKTSLNAGDQLELVSFVGGG